MNEAGLISASPGEAVEVQTTLLASRPLEEVETAPAIKRRGFWLPGAAQAAIAMVATAIAFWTSAASLLQNLNGGRAIDLLALAPVVAVALAVLIAIWRRRPDPNIHDRYLDYILGLTLLGLAVGAMLFLPASLSIFFWSWRLDLVALPLFLAGAVALLGGSRSLWRYRVPIAFPLLAWPMIVISVLVVAAISLIGVRIRSGSASPDTTAKGMRTGGGFIAAGIVLLAGVLTAAADQQLTAARELLQPDGQPAILATQRLPAEVGALRRGGIKDLTGFPAWGLQGSVVPYGTAPIVVNVFEPGEGGRLTLTPRAIAERQGLMFQSAQSEDLGGALVGQMERYSTRSGKRLVLVWWDWPVRSSGGVGRERVIVERLSPSNADDAGALLIFVRDLVTSMVHQASAP